MQVKTCPKCGKHNSVSAWNCESCGQTLSTQTLVKIDPQELERISKQNSSKTQPLTGESSTESLSAEQDEIDTVTPAEPIQVPKDWFIKYWYFLLFPAFVCSAGTQLTLPAPPVIIGLILSLLIVWESLQFTINRREQVIFVIIIPLILLLFTLLVSSFNSYEFRYVDINHPYLNDVQIVWRAAIAGIGGLVTVLVMTGAGKLWYNFKTK